MLGLVSAVFAEPGTGQLPAHRPGSQLALDHGPTVARTGRQPTAAEINQRLAERGAAPSAPQLHPPDKRAGDHRNRFRLPPQWDPAARDRGPDDPVRRRLNTPGGTVADPRAGRLTLTEAGGLPAVLTNHHRSPSR